MNLPCKELKRIARDNLNGNYKIPMGAFLAAWYCLSESFSFICHLHGKKK